MIGFNPVPIIKDRLGKLGICDIDVKILLHQDIITFLGNFGIGGPPVVFYVTGMDLCRYAEKRRFKKALWAGRIGGYSDPF